MHIQTDILLINGTYPLSYVVEQLYSDEALCLCMHTWLHMYERKLLSLLVGHQKCVFSVHMWICILNIVRLTIYRIFICHTYGHVCTSDVNLWTYSHPLPLCSEDLCCVFVICCSTQLPAAPHLPACSASTGNGLWSSASAWLDCRVPFPIYTPPPYKALLCRGGGGGPFVPVLSYTWCTRLTMAPAHRISINKSYSSVTEIWHIFQELQ